jgi:hypothetical protein
MATGLSYDAVMKRLIPAAVGVIVLTLYVPSLPAQNPSHVPSGQVSAPSHSFRPATGPTFLPRFNPGPAFRSPTPCCGTFSGGFTFGVGTPSNPFFPPTIGGHHHHGFNNFGGFIAVPYPVAVYPYYGYPSGYDMTSQDAQDSAAAEDQQEPPALTIFERRARSAPASSPAAPAGSYSDDQDTTPTITAADVAAAQANVAAQPGAAEPTSVLIFRDGHQLEVQNYAIVGDTLYDLTPGHPRKIALTSIDVPATVQANDDRGITFRVPAE